MTRVFITGATGLIGGALLQALLERGDEVVALVRSDAGAASLARAGVQVVRGDATDERDLERGMRGCQLAFTVAGVNTLCVGDPRPMEELNARGPVAAVRAAARAGISRLVHTSSAATIGEPPGTVGDERTRHRGWFLSTYERTKTEGERAAMSVAPQVGQDLVCVNPSSVQGPGRSGGTARFLMAYLDGRLPVFIPTMVSMVDIRDCVEGHLLAAERGATGERYILNGMTLSVRELLTLGNEVAGVRHRPRLLPRPAARVAAAAIEGAWRVTGRRPPLCREMVRTLLHGHRYDGSRAQRDLGLRYTEPQETLSRTVEWARAEGLVRA